MLSEKLNPRFSETDSLGHINNTVLPIWFEAARSPIFKLFTPDLSPNSWKLIVAKIEVEFKRELFYGQEVEIRTGVQRIGNSSFTLRQEAWQQQTCSAIGTTVMVRYDFMNKNSMPLSEKEIESLKNHLVDIQ